MLNIKYPNDFYMEIMHRCLYTKEHWFLFDNNNYDCLTLTADKELLYMFALINNFDEEKAFIEIWNEFRKHVFEQYITTDLDKYYYSSQNNIYRLYKNRKKICLVHYTIMKLQEQKAFIEQFSNKPYKIVTERTAFIKQNKNITTKLLNDLNAKLERNQITPILRGEQPSQIVRDEINDTAYFPYTDLDFKKILDVYLFLKAAKANEFADFMKSLKKEYGHIITFANKNVACEYFSDIKKGANENEQETKWKYTYI